MTRTNTRKKHKKGFTLVELLLVVSLLGIAFGVTSDILITIVRNQVKTQVANSLEQQANFVALEIERDLRNAYLVTGDTTSNVFTVSGRVNGVSYTVIYSYSSGVITRQNGSVSLPLTEKTDPGGVSVSCTGVSSTCFSVSGVSPTLVTLSMRFVPSNLGSSAVTPANTGFVDLNSSFVVRGTY